MPTYTDWPNPAPNDLNARFLDACRTGTPTQAMRLLDQGANPRVKDPRGNGAWHALAETTSNVSGALQPELETALMQRLSEAGVPVETRNKAGWTPLGLAVDHDHTALIDHLLGQGANPNVRTERGGTLLGQVAEQGSPGMVQRLLDHGADVHAVDGMGWTALHHASISAAVVSTTTVAKVVECVDRLLKAGANLTQGTSVEPTGNPSETPLQLTLRRNSPAVAERLIQGGAMMGMGVRALQALVTLGMERQVWATTAVLVAHGAADRVPSKRLQAWLAAVPPSEDLHRGLETVLLRRTLNEQVNAGSAATLPPRPSRSRL